MNIDREIAKIAENVMGWENQTGCLYFNDKGEIVHFDHFTDIRQAFMVVEKILSDNTEWQFGLDIAFGKYSALFFESAEGYIEHGAAESETIATAIYLAALKAIGGE